MKKFVVFILILCCLVSTAFVKVEQNPVFNFENIEKVCFVSDKKYEKVDIESVRCGDKYFNYCTLKHATENLEEYQKDMDGIQFYISNMTFDELKTLLKIEEITIDEIDSMKIYCGYTPYFQECVFIENRKVNVQVAITKNEMIVGMPLILTGY